MENKLNTKQIKYFNPLNDYFMRYMFAKEGHEHILKNLINIYYLYVLRYNIWKDKIFMNCH